MPISFGLNGKPTTLDADPDMPLLWAIREIAGLPGTKFGCGMALCGACTVHVDGPPIRSCVMPVSAVANRNVTTIEGLQSAAAKAVQAAWIKLQVPQCGYCQSAQVMSATNGAQRHGGGAATHMPEFGDTYSDAEIASVANYVTARFGAERSNLTVARVAKLRAQH